MSDVDGDDLATTDALGISFIIPVYNEEEKIKETIQSLKSNLLDVGRPHEIIVVDDGSSDQSLAHALEIDGITVICHPVNSGYGRSIKTGILSAKYEWIGITDADGTYDINALPRLIKEMDKGFDMVVARRQNVSDHDSLTKRFFRSLLIAFVKSFAAAEIVDPNSGFRIFKKNLAMLFFSFLCNTFSFTTSITLFAVGEGFFISMLDTEYFSRAGRSKVRKFRDSARMAQLVLQGITFFNPLKFYLMLALVQVVFVALPSWGLYQLGWAFVAQIYFLSATAVLTFLSVGVLADVIRISNNYDFPSGEMVKQQGLTIVTRDDIAEP